MVEGAGRVDQELLAVARGGPTEAGDGRIHEPRVQIGIVEDHPARTVERVLALGPGLLRHLLAGALHGGPAGEDAGQVPLGDADRQAVDHGAVPVVGGEVPDVPELGLVDAGDRPWGVDVDGVPVDDPHRPLQVELHADHPVGAQLVAARQLRVGGAEFRPPGDPGVLHRKSRDVMIGGDGPGRAAVRGRDAYAGDPAVAVQHFLYLGAEFEDHAERAQLGRPRVDPGLAGRRVEHPVGLAVHAPAEDAVDDEGLEDGARDGPGAGLLRLGGGQVAGQADAEQPLVVLGHLGGPDEVPPGHLLPLILPAPVAAGEVDQDPAGEVGDLVGGQVQDGVEQTGDGPQQGLRGEFARVRWCGEGAQGQPKAGAAGVAGEQRLGAVAQVAVDPVGVAAERDPAHRVGQVAVEAGEEPEAVLARQRPAAALAGARHVHAAGLATEHRVVLVDRHRVAAQGEFMGRAQP